MTILSRNETAQYLAEKDHFVILTHRHPDGDTIGCAALLCRGLRQLNKTAHVLENPEVTEKYAHLCQGMTKPAAEPDDVIVSVDVAAVSLLPGCFSHLADRINLRIDHHGRAVSFSDCELVDTSAAACGEVIYDVLRLMGAELTPAMADALYTAVSTDTGCFRYANTTDNTFRVAADCSAAGAQVAAINQALFETNTLARLRLQAYLIEHARFLQNGKAVVCTLSREKERELGVTEDDMENISGFPRSIAGVKMAVTIRENADGTVKASIRSVPGYDASAVCAKFGGGGHKGAAGVTLHMTLEEAAEALAAAIPQIG